MIVVASFLMDSDKLKGNNIDGLSVSIWWSKTTPSVHLKRDCKCGKLATKPMFQAQFNEWMMMLRGGLTQEQLCMCVKIVIRLPDPKLKTLGEKDIECIFIGYAEHSKAFRFYVIEPNESVLINSIIKSRDAFFDENSFSSFPRPSQRSLINGTEDIDGLVVLEESHYIEKVLKKFNYFDCTPVTTPMDTSEMLMSNNGQAVSQLEYSKMALKYLKKTMDYSLSYTRYPSVLEGYTNASWISNTKDNSSTSGYVFLLGGGAISWASKKKNCITSSTIESEFVALVTTSKEAPESDSGEMEFKSMMEFSGLGSQVYAKECLDYSGKPSKILKVAVKFLSTANGEARNGNELSLYIPLDATRYAQSLFRIV
ncbi:hypothetical protein Tco_0710020 [Tanacetum coccineum]